MDKEEAIANLEYLISEDCTDTQRYEKKKCLKGRCIWLTKDKDCFLLFIGIEKG